MGGVFVEPLGLTLPISKVVTMPVRPVEVGVGQQVFRTVDAGFNEVVAALRPAQVAGVIAEEAAGLAGLGGADAEVTGIALYDVGGTGAPAQVGVFPPLPARRYSSSRPPGRAESGPATCCPG